MWAALPVFPCSFHSIFGEEVDWKLAAELCGGPFYARRLLLGWMWFLLRGWSVGAFRLRPQSRNLGARLLVHRPSFKSADINLRCYSCRHLLSFHFLEHPIRCNLFLAMFSSLASVPFSNSLRLSILLGSTFFLLLSIFKPSPLADTSEHISSPPPDAIDYDTD